MLIIVTYILCNMDVQLVYGAVHLLVQQSRLGPKVNRINCVPSFQEFKQEAQKVTLTCDVDTVM